MGAAAPEETIEVLESLFATDDVEGRQELRTALANGGFGAFYTDGLDFDSDFFGLSST